MRQWHVVLVCVHVLCVYVARQQDRSLSRTQMMKGLSVGDEPAPTAAKKEEVIFASERPACLFWGISLAKTHTSPLSPC